jgi:hypothetical protein
MSPWARVPPGATVYCGGCGEPIAEGAPVYHIVVAHVTRPLVRCEGCEGAAPPDLPPLVVAAPAPAPRRPLPAFTPVAAIAAFDWRARAAGREPGEDDA